MVMPMTRLGLHEGAYDDTEYATTMISEKEDAFLEKPTFTEITQR